MSVFQYVQRVKRITFLFWGWKRITFQFQILKIAMRKQNEYFPVLVVTFNYCSFLSVLRTDNESNHLPKFASGKCNFKRNSKIINLL